MSVQKCIYVDIDDVLCDTAGAYLDFVEKQFGKKVRFEDIHSFNLQESFSLSDEENKYMFKCAHRSEFVLNIKPFDDAADILKQWRDMNFRIAVVTGRHTSSYQDSLGWLEDHEIPYDSFTMVDKYGWKDTDHKLAISLDGLKAKSFAFGVEDNLKMISFLAQTMGVPVLFHERPWNGSCRPSDTVIKFKCWRDLDQLSVA